jgi:hypothetical protein
MVTARIQELRPDRQTAADALAEIDEPAIEAEDKLLALGSLGSRT